MLGPLCEAFAGYPVMRYVLGPDGDYEGRLRILVGFFLAARVLRKDPILAVYDGGEVSGVAVCTLPGLAGSPDMDEARNWSARGRRWPCRRAPPPAPGGSGRSGRR